MLKKHQKMISLAVLIVSIGLFSLDMFRDISSLIWLTPIGLSGIVTSLIVWPSDITRSRKIPLLVAFAFRIFFILLGIFSILIGLHFTIFSLNPYSGILFAWPIFLFGVLLFVASEEKFRQ